MQMLTFRDDSRESSRIVTCEVESPHRKSNRVTHCVKHGGPVQMLTIRDDSRESCRIVTCEVESSHRKSNRVTHCVKHEGPVQMLNCITGSQAMRHSDNINLPRS